MTELQERAKKYLTSKGVKSTGDKFIALEVMDLLCEFVESERLNANNISDKFSPKQMEKAYNDGVKAEQQRCGGFDLENYY